MRAPTLVRSAADAAAAPRLKVVVLDIEQTGDLGDDAMIRR